MLIVTIIDAGITILILMGAAGIALLIGIVIGPLLNIDDRED